jgi:hypothetical protein
MNFQEGMRRIGLTVVVLGAFAASYAAYFYFADMAAQRKAQAEFESILKLPIVQKIARDVAKSKASNADIEIQGHPQGINQIRVNEKSEIDWFTMDDGKTFMRTHAPPCSGTSSTLP